ncbi:MAG: glycosyltransferase family 4 protein [Pseudomonadota bacterium]
MSARPMTVLQVVPALETGGAERTTVDIAAALTDGGHRAIVVSEGGRMVEELLAVGGKHVTMPASTKNIFRMRGNARRIAELAVAEGADIIHARSRAPAWSALWASSRAKTKFVTTYHGAYSAANSLKNFYNSVMARGDAVIANSAFTADLIGQRHPFARSRISTIHRGIDLTRFDQSSGERGASLRLQWGLDGEAAVLMSVARLTPWKGQDVLLDALKILGDRSAVPWVCVMAGDDQGRTEYRESLLRKAEELGISERVRLVGHVDDIPAALSVATLGVQPSTEPEAFGRAAVEAQAAGLPVVVSDLGAVRETVLAPPETAGSGRSGWRVPAGDADALAEALRVALATPAEERAAMGARGRAHAQANFSLTAMKQKTLDLYHSVLEDSVRALY